MFKQGNGRAEAQERSQISLEYCTSIIEQLLWEIRNVVSFTTRPYVLTHAPPTLFISAFDFPVYGGYRVGVGGHSV